jgi:S-adenosylmethionine:tRNA ribosyltransferase-isomerase
MLTSEFDYPLPNELIAQYPLPRRSSSRLMILRKSSGEIRHNLFPQIVDIVSRGDVLVFNDTKVIKARLSAKRHSGAAIEIFLLEPVQDQVWKAFLKPAKRVRDGESLAVSADFSVRVLQKDLPDGQHLVELQTNGPLFDQLEKIGQTPLPPYVKKSPRLSNRRWAAKYQTVLAQKPGAVAAPTAGLHFSKGILAKLRQNGVQIETVTLHVGAGTFQPISAERLCDHKMHEERYEIETATAERLRQARAEKRRIIAVGTTSARVLESARTGDGFLHGALRTDLFISPGYAFKAVDGLLTNFHLPRSSLLVLVSALAGVDFIREAYRQAVAQRYRFYSFGDAMLILP